MSIKIKLNYLKFIIKVILLTIHQSIDADYDKLKKEIIDLEKKYPFILEKYSSVNTIIGAPVAKNFRK